MKKLFTPFRVGVGLTAAWLLVGVLEVWRRGGIEVLQKMELNAVGDFFAGFFAPIAFLWLVLGYRQQGDELIASMQVQQEQLAIARQQLVSEQEAAAREREERRRAVAPDFALWTTGSSNDAHGLMLDLVLKNSGGDAHSIGCMMNLPGRDPSLVTFRTDLLHRGDQTEAIIRLPSGAATELFFVTLTYRDQDNRDLDSSFAMHRLANGHYLSTDPEPSPSAPPQPGAVTAAPASPAPGPAPT